MGECHHMGFRLAIQSPFVSTRRGLGLKRFLQTVLDELQVNTFDSRAPATQRLDDLRVRFRRTSFGLIRKQRNSGPRYFFSR